MALSGITADTTKLALTGLLMYIDDDTTPSATISGETLQFSADFAQLFAGKGVKVLVAEALKEFQMAMSFNIHEITPKAMNILYGGNFSTLSGSTRLEIRQRMNPPGFHDFRFVGENTEGKTVTIVLNNAKNVNYGDIAFDGQDFAAAPCVVRPYPETPGDTAEVMAYIDLAD
jgi:hypothetical protein